jgi:serine/threonine protein kinase
MSQATPTSPPILHGRYLIEEQLGVGRLAIVYRASDQRLQRKVLVHLFRKELMNQEPLRQRFIQEAHNGARLSHASLLEVFDSGEIGNRPYMITEFVEGPSLRELGALSLEDALLYFRQIVGAVAACQAAGVPHPPISSNNVILVGEGHIELFENWMTPVNVMALDMAVYRPPERTESGTQTPASVVYSLGLLLFEMLTGHRPITGDDPRAVALAHLNANIPTLSQVRPLLYVPALERLLQRATARDPQARPPNALAFSQALDDIRRTLSGDTQPLTLPPVQPTTLRERINRTAEEIVAPRPVPQPVDVSYEGVAQDPSVGRYVRPPARLSNRRQRSISGIVVVLVLLLSFSCGAYYVASYALSAVANVQLPRLEVNLPSLPELGFSLPEWLTGVVSGPGEVLVVNAGGGELNLRAEPGLKTPVTAVIPNGTRVRKLGGPEIVDDVAWLHVRVSLPSGEQEGWVSAIYVKPE